MTITFEEASLAYESYNKADTLMTNFKVVFPDGVNEVDPLLMIDSMQNRANLQYQLKYALALINSKKVEIYMENKSVETPDAEDEKVLAFTYNGQGQLSHLFQKQPYLLQLLLDYCTAHLVKKLTPPFFVSKE